MKAVTNTKVKFDAARILSAAGAIIKKCNFFEDLDQISLRHRRATEGMSEIELFRDGIGSLYDFNQQEFKFKEAEFVHNHPAIVGTYLEEVISTVARKSKAPIGRCRIMRIKPHRCYSWHWDPDEYRFHIPVETNDACFFLTEAGGPEKMPEPGRLYIVKTQMYHTALNASPKDRTHLVISTCSPD